MKNKKTDKRIEQLRILVTDLIAGAKKAADLLIQILDDGVYKLADIRKLTGLDLDILRQLERVGRKQIIAELLLSTCEATEELMKLPYSEQKRLYNGTVDVLERKEGKVSKRVKVRDLTREQVLMVFDNGSVRDLVGQRTYIDGKRRLNPAPKIPGKLEVIDKKEDVLNRAKGLKGHLKVTQGMKISWDLVIDLMPADVRKRL
jgi:hypothetical protein